MEEWEEKIEAMAMETIPKRVTCLSGVPTWIMILLKKVLEITGKKTVHEVWPHLELFLHGAVAFGPYRQIFQDLIGYPEMNYLESYNASEGYFAVQDDLSTDGEMLLLTDNGMFYEFIPMEEWDKTHPETVPLEGVELGKNYALLITTDAGLWRYRIGDTVRFTSKNPYRLKISGRTKHFMNAFGEEVVVENADQALTQACKQTGAQIKDYTAAPIYMQQGSRGGHEWAIEFEHHPDDHSKFVQVLDETLRQINSDYDAKRYGDIALGAPTVHDLEQGTFYEWLRRRGKLGGQYKVPRLGNDRTILEEILSLQNTIPQN
jgi:hypothetical protein